MAKKLYKIRLWAEDTVMIAADDEEDARRVIAGLSLPADMPWVETMIGGPLESVGLDQADNPVVQQWMDAVPFKSNDFENIQTVGQIFAEMLAEKRNGAEPQTP